MGQLLKVIVFGLVGCALLNCSSGGSSDGGSSAKPTGFLKAEIPSLPGSNSTSSVGAQSNIEMSSEYNIGYVASLVRGSLADNNTGDSCVGSETSIPFILCMIELLGINAPGEYSGNTPGGEPAVVSVTELTGDPDYALKAVAALVSGRVIFKYLANEAGTKGLVEALPTILFHGSGAINAEYGVRLAWDATGPQGKVDLIFHSSSSESTQVSYTRVLVDSAGEIADVAYRSYFFGPGSAKGVVMQIRSGATKDLGLAMYCSDTSSPVDGTDCFAVGGTWGFVKDMSSTTIDKILCGTQGPLYFDALKTWDIDNSYGSYAVSSTTSGSESACDTLMSSQRNSENFAIRLDQDDSSGDTINGIFHDVRGIGYSAMKILDSGSFLSQ